MTQEVVAHHIPHELLHESRMLRVLGLKWPLWARGIITFGFMALLVCVVSTFSIPNPNIILMAGLVICSAFFGTSGGIVSAAVMLAYTFYFFSVNHSFTTFTSDNGVKVLVTVIGVTIVGVFVCKLRQVGAVALRDARALADMLMEDNALLEEASTVDVLTGLRNRFSLRRDYARYAQADELLNVMMIDLDNFKDINDVYGHEQGDTVLSQIGSILLDVFGKSHCYRYGGDEFLVIVPNWSSGSFEDACKRLRNQMREVTYGGGYHVHFSGGYAYGVPQLQSDLRLMIRQADDSLYRAKHAGKDCVQGTEYNRAYAEGLEPDNRSTRAGDRR